MKDMPSSKNLVTRTFRLPTDYDDVLKEEAENLGNSVNSIIDIIVAKYVYNDRFYTGSQLLSISPNTITSLLAMLDDDDIIKAGKLAGGTQARDNLLMRGMRLDFPSIKWFIEEIMTKYAGWFSCNYHQVNGVHMFHLRHVLDKKWSLFVQSYLEAMVENIMDINVDAVVSDNTVTLRIPLK